MEKKYSNGGGKKVVNFFKKNIYYVLIALCIIAVVTMITVAAVSKNNLDPGVVNPDPDPNPGPGPDPEPAFVLILPVAGNIVGHFDDQMPVEISNGDWKVHLGLDIAAPAGSEVFAAYDGKVIGIDNNVMSGSVITIEHKDGFVTVYKHLADEVNVELNQTVKQGDVIGTVAPENDFAIDVCKEAHIHFELKLDGEEVDPMEYLPEGDK